jgi:nucleoside-diphosphate-sugar epimerase
VKILVTGATGFIGGHYVRHLLARTDVSVSGCGRNPVVGEILQAQGATFFQGDLLEESFIKRICEQIDVVVHCAAMGCLWGDYLDYYRANVQTTEQLIRACQQAGVSRLINISTPSIYFDWRDRLNITENWLPKRFVDNYARTKYQAECRVTQAHTDRLATVSLRPRMVIGVGDQNILPKLIRLHQQGHLKRIGSGRNQVSVTSVANLMQALDLCVFGSENALGTVYNIANAEPVPIWQLIDSLMAQLHLPPVRQRIPYPLAWLAATAMEGGAQLLSAPEEPRLMRLKVALMARSLTLSIDKARQRLGYQPLDDIDATLAEYAKWWLTQAKAE